MKLRLPNKLIAAIVAAASPVLFSTLSTATLGAAAVAAVAGHAAMAEAVEVTYTSQTAGVGTGNATVKKSGSEAEGTGAETYTATIQLGDFTATDLTSITISGNGAGTISNNNTNGGYGGRITTNGTSSTITQFVFNKGIEVTLKEGTNAAGKTLVFDNASFWGEGNANYAASILINEGGARMNGGWSNNYTVSGSISGTGDLYIVSGDAAHTQTFTGSLADYTGTIYGKSDSGAQRKMTFGNGGAATDIGGSIGKSDAVFREVVFNSTGNQSVTGNVYATTLTTQNLTSLAVGGVLQTTTLNLGNTVLSVGGTASVNGVLTSSATTGVFTGAGSLALGDNFSVAGLTTGDNYSTGVMNKGFITGGEQFALVTETGRGSLTVTLGSALTNDGWSYNAENGMLFRAQQTRSVYHVGSGITVSRSDTDAEAQRVGLEAYTVQVDNGGKMTFAQDNPASATTYSLNNILSGVSSSGTLEIDYGSNATLTWDKTSNLAGSVVLKSGNLVNSGNTQVSRDLTIVLDGAEALFSADRSLRTNLEVRNGSVFSVGHTDVIDYDNTGYARTLVLDGGTLNVGNYRQTVRSYTFTLRNGGKIAGAGSLYGSTYQAALDVIAATTINASGAGNVIEGNVAARDNNTITIATANAGDELTLKGLVVSNSGGGVAKTGNGTLVLSGTKGGVATHTGKFALQGGTLAIAGGQTVKMTKSLSFSNAANVSIASGNTLDLTGLSTAITAANYLDFVSNKRFVGEGTVKMNGNTDNNTTPGMEVMLAQNNATDKAILTHYDITGAITFNGSGTGNEQNGKAVLTIGNGTIAAGLKTSQDMRLGNFAHLKVSENASLEVGGRLWLGHNGDTGSLPGLLTINGGDVTLGSVGIKSSGSANKLIMNGGSLEFTTAGNIVKGFSSKGGDPDLDTSSTVFALNRGTLKANSASWTLNHKATIGAVTVETDADHTIGITGSSNTYQGTITNKGNLSLSGSGSVNIADIGNFEVAGERVASDFDGEGTYAGSGHLVGTDTQYYLVKDGTGSSLTVGGAFTLTGGSRVGSGNHYIFTFADGFTLPTDTYFINSDLTYNSTEMDDAKISVSQGTKLTVDSAVASTTTNIVNHGTVLLSGSNASNNGAALLKVTDDGGVVVGSNTTIAGGAVTQATGNLTIRQGALLSVGGGDTQTNSLSSFSSLTLDNGSIKYQNKMDDLHNVTVAKGSTGKIASKDMGPSGSAALRLLGTTRVDGTLTMNNYWNAQFEIAHLTGSGELKLTAMSGVDNLDDTTSSNEAASYTISSLSGFSGTLTVDNQKITSTFHSGTAAATLKALNVTHSTTTATGGVTFLAEADTTINTVTVGSSGKLVLKSVQGGSVNLNKVITNNGSATALTLGGEINATLDATRTGEVAPRTEGNGYGTGLYSASLVSNGQATILDGTSWTVNGHEGTYSNGNLTYTDDSAQEGLYYVNENTVVYQEGSAPASAATTGLVLNAGTLELAKALANGHTITANGGTLRIDNGVTLAHTALTVNGATTLAGSGTLTQSTAEMSTLIDATDAAWQGTIDLGGNGPLNVTNLDLSRYGNSGSTVILHGLSGSVAPTSTLENGTMVIASAVELNNSPNGSSAAWSIGTHADGASYKFTNTFGGSGNFRKETGTGTLNMEFAGGIDTWTGSSIIVSGVWALTLSGDVTGWRGLVSANNGAGINVTATGDLKGWTSTVAVSGDSSFSFNQEGDKSAATGVTYNANGGTTTIGGTASDIAFQSLSVDNNATIAVNSDTLVKGIVSKGANGGSITIAEGKALTIQSATAANTSTYFANGLLQGEGKVNITGADDSNSFEISINGGSTHTSTLLTNYNFSKSIAINGRGYSGSGGYPDGETLNIGTDTQKGSITVEQDLRLESKAHVNVTKNGSLTVKDELIMGHEQADNEGILNINGGAVALNSMTIRHATDNNQLNLNSGTLTFTKEGQVVSGGTATDNTSINLNGGTLKADSVSWNLNHKATIGNDAVVKMDAAQGKTATLSGALSGSGTIHATGEGTVNLSGNMENFSGSIAATQGTLQFLQQASSVNVADLTIMGQDATHRAEVGVYSGSTKDTSSESGIAVSGTLTANQHATLNANLTMQGGSTIDVAEGGLQMGSSVTFAGGEKMNLSDNIISGLNSLTVGSGLTLFSGVDSFNLGGAAYNAANTYTASDYFNLERVNIPSDFVIKYDTGIAALSDGTNQAGQSIFIWREMPEPATATLSLLALAALAAKRKRR